MAVSTTKPPPTESAAIKGHLRNFNLVMYILIFVVSVPANIVMLLVLWRKFRRHRKTAKSFIVLMHNLALSGIVLVICSIPFDLVWQGSDTWPFGPGGCKILWPLQTAALQAMVYSYVALACHRLRGVTKWVRDVLVEYIIMKHNVCNGCWKQFRLCLVLLHCRRKLSIFLTEGAARQAYGLTPEDSFRRLVQTLLHWFLQ